MAARGTCNWDNGELVQTDLQAVADARRRTIRIVVQSLLTALLLTIVVYWMP